MLVLYIKLPVIPEVSDPNIIFSTPPEIPHRPPAAIKDCDAYEVVLNIEEIIENSPPVPPVHPLEAIMALLAPNDTEPKLEIMVPGPELIQSFELIIDAPSTTLDITELLDAATKLLVVLTETVPIFANETGPCVASNTNNGSL
jgi:hypothetical protein